MPIPSPDWAVPLPAPIALPLEDGTCYPVVRVFCIGLNYAAHAAEMGTPQPPIFFDKASLCIRPGDGPIAYPPQTSNLHYEGEMVVAINASLFNADYDSAQAALLAYGVGIDFTRRDLQLAAKAQGNPWDLGKSFTNAAPVGILSRTPPPATARLTLHLNGEIRQNAPLTDMIYDPATILMHLSRYERLQPGDLIFTGTPAGVGPALPGDALKVQIDGLPPLNVTLTAARDF